MDANTLDILVKTVLGEARGEGPDGMAAVAHVIRNRSLSGQYPRDPAKVAQQPKQFSTWNTGEGGNNPNQFKPGSAIYEEARRVVEGVFAGSIPDATGGSLFYHTTSTNPSWADDVVGEMGTRTIGNHVFYPQKPIAPPADIPNVAPVPFSRPADLGTIPPPVPAMQSPELAARRNGALDAIESVAPLPMDRPSGLQMPYQAMAMMQPPPLPSRPLFDGDSLIANSFAALDRPASQTITDATPRMNRDGSITSATDIVFWNNPDYTSAGSLPKMPSPMPSVSDMVRGRSQPSASPSESRPSVGSISDLVRATAVAPGPVSPSAPRQSFSASDMVRGNSSPRPLAPTPASAEDRVTARNTALPPVERLPPIAPPTQAPPPMPVTPSLPLSSERAATSVVDVGLQRALEERARAAAAPAPAPLTASDRVRAAQTPPMPAMPSIPGPAPATKSQDRLVTAGLPPANYGTVALPSDTAVATQLDVAQPPMPMPATARPPAPYQPTPLPTPTPVAAPTPAPRLERPGIFGKQPNIFGIPVKLPGALGIIQGATAAMNNASGPFSNGVENLLYNAFRGGDFNTPGAATGQAGGFLYAPNGQGGYVNVGRVDPSRSAADTYAALNAGNRRTGHGAVDRFMRPQNDGGDGGVQPTGTIW